jgi:transcriptional regulator with XRE-family HTH domain
MGLSTSEKVKIILKRRGMTMGDLAEKTGQTRQNLSNKMSRDNFPEKEIREIAAALDCEYETFFVMRDTGDKV